jgi:hypothetical protein
MITTATAPTMQGRITRPAKAIILARSIVREISLLREDDSAVGAVLNRLMKHSPAFQQSLGIDAIANPLDTFESLIEPLVDLREYSPTNVCVEPEQVVIDVTECDYQPEQGEKFSIHKRGFADWAPVGGWSFEATAYPEVCEGRKLVTFVLEANR